MDVGEMLELIGMHEDDEADELGQRARRYRRPSTRRKRTSRRRRIKAALREELTSAMPGVPKQGARGWPLGFDVAAFVFGGPTQIDVVARPQKPIKGNRLLSDVRPSLIAGGTTLLTNLTTIDKVLVGTNSQLVGTAPLPASGFAPGAFDTMLDLDSATPGIDITVGYTISTPVLVATEFINVSTMLITLSAG